MRIGQSEINIGMVGHVDHGKTTLTQALSGVWTDVHSEELKRGISIRLGYADTTFRKCPKCSEPECYTTEKKCPVDGSETTVLRTVSFVDSPGHETLMATMLSGAAIMDGALLVIAANEPCPQPQTKEHLMALDVIGVKKVVVVQNKIDIVPPEKAKENYEQIKEFLKGTVAEDAPIVPVAAQHGTNIDLLIQEIERTIPTPKRDRDKPPKMLIARSFDINKPGTRPENMVGGVVGGSLVQGVLSVDDEVEIRPGFQYQEENRTVRRPILTKVESLIAGGKSTKKIYPGGLVGVGTLLDPSLTKSDGLSGRMLSKPGVLPPEVDSLLLEIHLLKRVVGTKEELEVEAIRTNEPLMLNILTTTTVGIVTSARKDEVEIRLKLPTVAEKGSRVAVSRRIGTRWRLIGYGIVK
ncbi:MAG: translation initiation factor IF-2 subunit gamma [Methanobacteriota archaeon]|nr:MAG: translation initiation factor IF-2 subunit gamma [Euryarchaeota archaeon]